VLRTTLFIKRRDVGEGSSPEEENCRTRESLLLGDGETSPVDPYSPEPASRFEVGVEGGLKESSFHVRSKEATPTDRDRGVVMGLGGCNSTIWGTTLVFEFLQPIQGYNSVKHRRSCLSSVF